MLPLKTIFRIGISLDQSCWGLCDILEGYSAPLFISALMRVPETWEEKQFVNMFGTANKSINTPESCESWQWLTLIINNNNDINPDVNGTYLDSHLKYYHQLNDCLYLFEGFNRAIHSLSSWILLLKSSSTSQFSLHKGGLKLYYHSSVQRDHLVNSRSICSEDVFSSHWLTSEGRRKR